MLLAGFGEGILMNIIYVITSTNMRKGISSFIGRRSLTNKGVVRSPLYSYRQTERKESLSDLPQRERSPSTTDLINQGVETKDTS